MSKMYYAETPDAAHDIHDLKVNLLGESFQFYTDAGVFSKKMIDFGSQVLLSALDLEAGKHTFRCGLWLWSSRYQFGQGPRS
ncbi:MAG: methyltransferase [Streptococcus salivarius]